MAWTATSALPSALESGRMGIERAMEMQRAAAQGVAEISVLGGHGDVVSLSNVALGLDSGSNNPPVSLESSLIDADVAKYLALANARVVQTSAETFEEAATLLPF